MIYTYLLLSIFVIILFKAKNKYRVLYSSLLALYAFSFASTIILNSFSSQNNIRLTPILFLLIILFLWIKPFYYVKQYETKKEKELKRIKNVILIFGSLSVIALFYFIHYAKYLFFSIDLSLARNIVSEESILPYGNVSLFFISLSSIYHIYIYFFYYSIVEKLPIKYAFIMLLASLSFPAMVLCYFGRDGIFYWSINFIIMFLYFSHAIPYTIKRKIKLISSSIIISFVAIFMLITMSRFQNSTNSIFHGLLNYSGQQLENFSEIFNTRTQGNSLFPTLDTILQKLGIKPFINQEEFVWRQKVLLGDNYNVFSFFVGSIIIRKGILYTFIFSLISSAISLNFSIKNNKHPSTFNFIIIYSFFQIPLLGVFYYRQAVSYMDIGFIYIIIIYLYIKYKVF